jgi:AraC-like DNA-binding protein
VVVGANWYRFRPAEQIHHDLVVSTSIIWVITGSGTVASGGEEFRLTSHSVLRLPWRHEVSYRADARSPFQIGTIHVIPWHDASIPVEPRVAFTPGDPLLDVDYRQGPTGVRSAQLLSGASAAGRNMIALASYAVERFMSAPFGESAFRALGTLIMDETASWTATDRTTPNSPVALELMTDHVVANLERHLTVAEIADAGGCSTTTAERIFAKYTGASVLAWVRGKRMEEAALLLRTSGLRAGEVARRVGFTDPLYFSRVFRNTFGVPPSRYAVGQLRP